MLVHDAQVVGEEHRGQEPDAQVMGGEREQHAPEVQDALDERVCELDGE